MLPAIMVSSILAFSGLFLYLCLVFFLSKLDRVAWMSISGSIPTIFPVALHLGIVLSGSSVTNLVSLVCAVVLIKEYFSLSCRSRQPVVSTILADSFAKIVKESVSGCFSDACGEEGGMGGVNRKSGTIGKTESRYAIFARDVDMERPGGLEESIRCSLWEPWEFISVMLIKNFDIPLQVLG